MYKLNQCQAETKKSVNISLNLEANYEIQNHVLFFLINFIMNS